MGKAEGRPDLANYISRSSTARHFIAHPRADKEAENDQFIEEVGAKVAAKLPTGKPRVVLGDTHIEPEFKQLTKDKDFHDRSAALNVQATPTGEFREGNKVILHGLSNEDLNGQKGTITPLKEPPNQDNPRYPVLLESGQKLSIR